MLRAQMRQILQARDILIEQAISSALDHALRRQLIDVLPRAAEVNRQLVAAHQNRSMRRAVAPLRSIRRRRLQFGHILPKANHDCGKFITYLL